MDTTRGTNLWRTKQKKADLASVLRKAWYHLRLSVRHPTRVATWDAIVLTAASPEQAELYEWQLNRSRRMGRIAESTVTLAVPDPDGQRIGSGAATLHAIYALAKHYEKLGVELGPQVRLPHKVLQKVVTRYLRGDNLLISSIKRLVDLAKIGREALMNCDMNELGEIMLEAWRLHQELDPFCSNEFVDKLFSFAGTYCCGCKLVGAGGGGFALLLTKDADCAKKLRHELENETGFDVKVYDWKMCLD